MDIKLENLKQELLDTWFLDDVSIFNTNRSTASDFLTDLFDTLLRTFQNEFPSMEGKYFVNWVEGTRSTCNIGCGDHASIAVSDSFTFSTAAGDYVVYFDKDTSGTAIPPVGLIGTPIAVDITTGDTAVLVATKLSSAIDTATTNDDVVVTAAGTVVTIRNLGYGVLDDPITIIGLGTWTYSQTTIGNLNRLYMQEIDPAILEILAVNYSNVGSIHDQVTSKLPVQNIDYTTSLTETVTRDLYSEFIQNEWSSALDHPAILYDEVETKDYFYPKADSFVIFIFKQRTMTVDLVPSFIWKPLKWYLTGKAANTLHGALSRKALQMGLANMESQAQAGSDISPDRVSSVSIGNLSLSLAGKNSYSLFSDLLAAGGGRSYLSQLDDIRKTNQNKFEREKFIRYGGMIR